MYITKIENKEETRDWERKRKGQKKQERQKTRS